MKRAKDFADLAQMCRAMRASPEQIIAAASWYATKRTTVHPRCAGRFRDRVRGRLRSRGCVMTARCVISAVIGAALTSVALHWLFQPAHGVCDRPLVIYPMTDGPAAELPGVPVDRRAEVRL
jgi:hypothetical protein